MTTIFELFTQDDALRYHALVAAGAALGVPPAVWSIYTMDWSTQSMSVLGEFAFDANRLAALQAEAEAGRDVPATRKAVAAALQAYLQQVYRQLNAEYRERLAQWVVTKYRPPTRSAEAAQPEFIPDVQTRVWAEDIPTGLLPPPTVPAASLAGTIEEYQAAMDEVFRSRACRASKEQRAIFM